ncbi:CASP8-associated protein 2 isoform X1 [Fundulus heteroclitus]|uniref:CASP8-associated protein 2 isoform X1 n=1 Tax=Fundulus heteroclitus TaxID=8078 RepID=UPI00165A56D2|nr:CASP8-associated protein 2 isoform X1 [Fundulus heteroclitus]
METCDESSFLTSCDCAVVAPGADEDSVDIYEGLDGGIDSNTEKSPPVSSQLKDSMDLYEDIVAEEQQNRDCRYSELKSRFEAAQKQIKELHRRLEQMELQNTRLTTENNRLKKNISALLRTARQEVVRKDAEIQRLTQRAGRFPHYHPSKTKSIQDPNWVGRTSIRSSIRTLSPQSPPNSQSKEELPLVDAPQPTTKAPCDFSRSTTPPLHNHSQRGQEVAKKQTEPGRHESRDREERNESQKLSASTDRRLRNGSHHDKDSDQKQVHNGDKDTGQGCGSRSHKYRKSQNIERHCRSDGAKTSSQERLSTAASSEQQNEGSKVQRRDEARTASLEHDKAQHYPSGGNCLPEYRRISKSHTYDRWSSSKDKKSSSPEQSKRSGEGSKERERDQHRDHQRRADRCRDEVERRRHRKSSQKENSREHRKHRAKQPERRREKKAKDVKRSAGEPDASMSVDENNSNKKLCFMETLNLTLSPIKKHVLPKDSSAQLPKVDGSVEEQSAEEHSQPDMDDLCVIDEVDSSELQAELEHVAERPTQDLTAPSNQTISDSSDVDDGMENAKNGNESAGETLSVLSSPPQRQSQDATGGEEPVPCKDLSSKSCSSPAADDSEHCEKLVSGGQLAGHGQLEVTESSQPSDTSPSIGEQQKSTEVQSTQPDHAADLLADGTEAAAAVNSDETAVPASVSIDAANNAAASPQPKDSDDPEHRLEKARTTGQRCVHAVSPAQPGLCLPSSTSVPQGNDHLGQLERSKDPDSVSSSICLDSFPQEGLSLSEAIYVMTQTDEDPADDGDVSSQPHSSVGYIGVSKVSSTTEEDMYLGKSSALTVTPQKTCSQDPHAEPSSSVSLPHDEDSMMHTLSNLRRIPEAISPLRSPIQTAKRSLLHVQSKLAHVKSLQKDFSTIAVENNLKKLDVNKENKYPGSPANREAQNMASDQTSSRIDMELEEGEILSESDEAASSSHVPATKKAKLTEPVKNKPSITSLRKPPEEGRVVSKEPHDSAALSTHSPRSRFKSVCPAVSKTSFSTIEEIMETFKLVRTEMRKKYMKLHKTFPKKSFYGVMDNFQKSFVEFVDGAQFGQMCSEPEELKSKLRMLIASVFTKVFNNGIVKRIFEQQAVNLKQKLWDFVDNQVDYLFLEIRTTLKRLCQPVRAPVKVKRSNGEETDFQQTPVKKPLSKQNESNSHNSSPNGTKSCAVVPYRTGLGSRGKDIRMSHTEEDSTSRVHPPERANKQDTVDFLSCSNLLPSPEKNTIPSLVSSQNGSLLDKTDFELLTEQQASSLTFNLVRDSQMGEIFKCLLQGSDLLESTGMPGDGTTWSVGTPRKDGERFFGFSTPSKFLSPSKSEASSRLISTWSSISPRKRSSPCAKDKIPLNPALFDESCLLEVPSGNAVLLQGCLAAEKSYSILAEDLAVSLTIPSPLKSDGSLSFLQPAGTGIQVVSTPDSVINAHISEDALLEGEDATEQDIHLALDNSSCSSKDSTASETPASGLVFKPDVPMQALVMEKSNDHFVVRIRQMSVAAEPTLIAQESLSQTLVKRDRLRKGAYASAQECQNNISHCTVLPSENKPCLPERPRVCQPDLKSDTQEQRGIPTNNSPKQRQAVSSQSEKTSPQTAPSDASLNTSSQSSHHVTVTDGGRTQPRVEKAFPSESHKPSVSSKRAASSSCVPSAPLSPASNKESRVAQADLYDSNVSESEKSLTIDTSSSSEKTLRGCGQLRKRKKRQGKLKTKRSKKEENGLQEASPSKSLSPAALSPSSLSAKNIVRKKGEVVMAWTRDEDRAILMYLKTKGASRETFSTLSEKLNKPSSQVAHRFYQLMKLFKKQEEMDT